MMPVCVETDDAESYQSASTRLSQELHNGPTTLILPIAADDEWAVVVLHKLTNKRSLGYDNNVACHNLKDYHASATGFTFCAVTISTRAHWPKLRPSSMHLAHLAGFFCIV